MIEGAYVAFLAYVGWCSVRSSARAHAWPATVLEVITSLGWPILVAAYFWPAVAGSLGRAAAPLYVVIGAWTLYTIWRDFRPSAAALRMPHDMSAMQRNVTYAVSALICALIVVPVFLIGAAVAARAVTPAV